MLPFIDLHIGDLHLKLVTYPIMIGLSIIAATILLPSTLIKTGIGIKKSLISVIIIIAFAIIGARLFFYILYPHTFSGSFFDAFNLEFKNFTLYGGIFGAFVGVLLLSRKFGFSLLKFMDNSIWIISISLFISRLGCLFNGCCYGKTTEMPWGIVMQKDSLAYRAYIKTHPFYFISEVPKIHYTQLYELIVIFLAFVIGLIILSKKKYHKKDGIAALYFGITLTIGRFIVYFFREFPYATDISNFIRGPVVYTVTLIILIFLLKKNK